MMHCFWNAILCVRVWVIIVPLLNYWFTGPEQGSVWTGWACLWNSAVMECRSPSRWSRLRSPEHGGFCGLLCIWPCPALCRVDKMGSRLGQGLSLPEKCHRQTYPRPGRWGYPYHAFASRWALRSNNCHSHNIVTQNSGAYPAHKTLARLPWTSIRTRIHHLASPERTPALTSASPRKSKGHMCYNTALGPFSWVQEQILIPLTLTPTHALASWYFTTFASLLSPQFRKPSRPSFISKGHSGTLTWTLCGLHTQSDTRLNSN